MVSEGFCWGGAAHFSTSPPSLTRNPYKRFGAAQGLKRRGFSAFIKIEITISLSSHHRPLPLALRLLEVVYSHIAATGCTNNELHGWIFQQWHLFTVNSGVCSALIQSSVCVPLEFFNHLFYTG
ncbi:hypothetical protein ACFX1R_029455 [Malus domestica]